MSNPDPIVPEDPAVELGETSVSGGKSVPLQGTKVDANPFSISIPDLRNGALVNIQQAAPKASMSSIYHWPAISGATHADMINIVEYMIRACFSQALTTLEDKSPGGDELKKKAIVLGAVRAGAAAAFKLTIADMTASELVASGMSYADGKIGQNAKGTTSMRKWSQAQTMSALTPTEWSVVSVCVYMGMAIAPLQGVSLVMTGHHYIPPTYNMFAGLKRQALGSATKDAADWVGSLGEMFDDMAFHKALHPVNPVFKRELAKDLNVKTRLMASGHGSAAIRLPAVPSEASGGKAVIALLVSAASTAKVFGHTITATSGSELMLNLTSATDAVQEAEATDRIVRWVAANTDSIAFCGGIIQHVHEISGAGRNTILAAYSVKRIMADSPASVAAGVAYARAALGKIRDDMTSGQFSDPSILM